MLELGIVGKREGKLVDLAQSVLLEWAAIGWRLGLAGGCL